MNTEKVFVTYDKEGNERLIYKKDDNTYIDLLSKNNDVVNVDDIDMKFIIPFKVAIKNKDNMFKNNIVRSYNKDREQLIDSQDIYYAPIYEVEKILNCNLCKTITIYNIPMIDKVSYSIIFKKYSVFQNIDNNSYKDLFSNEIFSSKLDWTEIESGAKFINFDKPYKTLNNNGYIQKKKTLELSYELKKIDNKNGGKK